MAKFKHIVVPKAGKKIDVEGENIIANDHPIIPFIEGDGIGPDIWQAAKHVFDSAINKTYKGRKKIEWMEIFAGEKAVKKYGKDKWLPKETINAIKEYTVAIKGPLTTPAGGIKSLNVTLRQNLDLFACVRPVKYYSGAPSLIKRPQNLDIVIFRENTEDVYSGIEFKANTKDAKAAIKYINTTFRKSISEDSGLGIKPISEFATMRLVMKAIKYAIQNNRKSVTLVHSGNIMKFTEGAFRDWGYKAAKKFFPDTTINEDELLRKYRGKMPKGKILIKDRIADTMFQQILLRPEEYDVVATPNQSGDYLSYACAAQVGGAGIAPGSNMSYSIGLFEATHGTAPRYAGKDKVNPGSLILSGVMMLQYIGWGKSAELIERALKKTIRSKAVTYDFARLMKGAKEVKCSQFANQIVKNM